MDYIYYYDQLDDEVDNNEDYDYESMIIDDETIKEVYQGCIKSSTKQVLPYIGILLGCGLLQRLLWELVKRTWGYRYQGVYHVTSLICGLLSLWFYVGLNSIYVFVHVINLCVFLWLIIRIGVMRNTGVWLCVYTIVCQLIFECLLTTEHYENIRGPQMVVSMKLISLAFDIQNSKEKYQFLAFIGYLLCPSSLILGPWVAFKDYKPVLNVKLRKLQQIMSIVLYAVLALVFLNLSNCLIPWLKKSMKAGLGFETYLDALSVRCSHYFVCYLAQATLTVSSASVLPSQQQQTVKPLAIEFPRSLSDVIRNWNIPMHLWLKQNIFHRLRSSNYPYFMAVFLTYLVSCLVHGFNYEVHLVLMSLALFSYFEHSLRRCLAQVFNACIESTACSTNCKYLYCPRSYSGSLLTPAILVVRLVNFVFSLLVVVQLAYLGVMLNFSSSSSSSPSTDEENKGLSDTLQVWSNMNYLGHSLGVIMLVFYKLI